MDYGPKHAAQALEVLKRLLPYVKNRQEYQDLILILQDPTRWKEAHGQFSKIRVNVTLASDASERRTLEDVFVFVAENAAKTAYNCSGESAPFDNESFDRLLKCEQQFLERLESNK